MLAMGGIAHIFDLDINQLNMNNLKNMSIYHVIENSMKFNKFIFIIFISLMDYDIRV